MICRSGDSFSPLASGHNPIWPSVDFAIDLCVMLRRHSSTPSNLHHTLVPASLLTSLDRRPWRPDQSPKDLSSSLWLSSSNIPLWRIDMPLLFPLMTVMLPATVMFGFIAIKSAAATAVSATSFLLGTPTTKRSASSGLESVGL